MPHLLEHHLEQHRLATVALAEFDYKVRYQSIPKLASHAESLFSLLNFLISVTFCELIHKNAILAKHFRSAVLT